ncbi:MAG: tripartite tricarboxylate transporter substrate binding protein [Rhodospirillales bacterium]|nr:tripartite tricarboxylate transporter substrate binding protein [Rhodospirillales bacterium]
MTFFKSKLLIAAGALMGLAINPGADLSKSGQARAEFPTKPIKVYVGFKPGGRTDTVARLVAKYVQENNLLSQPMIIVNKPGAAAANAARDVLGAKPDGHSILHWHHQLLITNAMGVNKIHPQDFTSLGFLGGGSPVWTVRADSGLNSLADLVNKLKAEPESLLEAIGIGTIPHLMGVQLAAAAGFKTRYIGSGGGADRLAKLLGKNADIALFSASEYLRFKPQGVKALVFFGPNRIASLPDVPTTTELGYDAVWANPNWWLGPKNMDKEAAAKLSSVLKQAISSKEMIDYFNSKALDPYWTDGEPAMEQSLKVLDKLKVIVKEQNLGK